MDNLLKFTLSEAPQPVPGGLFLPNASTSGTGVCVFRGSELQLMRNFNEICAVSFDT